MKRIGIDARMYGSAFTGIGKHTERLIQNIAKIIENGELVNVEFVIFCESKNLEAINKLSPAFKTIATDIPHYSFAEQFKLPLVLSHARLDLMHFPHFNAPLLYRGKTVATIHDLILSFYPGKSKFGWLKEKAYKITLGNIVQHAKKIIAVSDYTKKDLVELLNADSSKITTIYNGCDEEFFVRSTPEEIKKVQDELGIGDNTIVYVGLQREHKNVGRLIRAIKPLVNTGFEGKLVLVGKEDPRYTEPREIVRELGLQKQVVFTGHMPYEQVRKIVQGAKIFCLPSLYEGFGIPVLEAMASGVPVVCSKATSLPEVGGDAVRYFHPMRVDEISAALFDVLEDSALREKMIQDGIEQAKKFTWDKMARETVEIYKSLIDYNPTLSSEPVKIQIQETNTTSNGQDISTNSSEELHQVIEKKSPKKTSKKKSSEDSIEGGKAEGIKGGKKETNIQNSAAGEVPEAREILTDGDKNNSFRGDKTDYKTITTEDSEIITIESFVEIK